MKRIRAMAEQGVVGIGVGGLILLAGVGCVIGMTLRGMDRVREGLCATSLLVALLVATGLLLGVLIWGSPWVDPGSVRRAP